MKILLFLGLTVLGCIANPDPDPDPGVHINVQVNIKVDKLSSGDKNEEIKKLEADIDALDTKIAEKEQLAENVAKALVQLNILLRSLGNPPQPDRRKRQSEVNLGNCGGNDFIGPFETVVLDLLAALTNAAENGGDVSCLLDKLTLLNDEIEAGSVEVPADTTTLMAEIQTTVTETEQYNVEIIEEIKQLQENLEEKQKELEEVINEQGGEEEAPNNGTSEEDSLDGETTTGATEGPGSSTVETSDNEAPIDGNEISSDTGGKMDIKPDCSTVKCRVPDCADIEIKQGECCPSCVNIKPDCSTVKCRVPECADTEIKVGECCPICVNIIKPDCSTVICRVPDCADNEIKLGECCPICVNKLNCITKTGEVYNINDRWSTYNESNGESCQICYCRYLSWWEVTEITCREPFCYNNFHEDCVEEDVNPDTCCPNYYCDNTTCQYDYKYYAIGDIWASKCDPCEQHSCVQEGSNFPNVTTETIECQPPPLPGCVPKKYVEECCPYDWDCTNSYLLSTPSLWVTGEKANIHLFTTGNQESIDINLNCYLESNGVVVSENDIEVTVNGGEYVVNELDVSENTMSSNCKVICNGNVGETNISSSFKVQTSAGEHIFVQTDKFLYMQGQSVFIRTLKIEGRNLRPSYENVTVHLLAPKGTRLAQWNNIQNEQGIVQVEYPLSDDAMMGIYRVEVFFGFQKSTQTFKVEPYVLPRFSVTISPPSYVLNSAKEIPFTVCAKYTYGQNLQGQLHFTVKTDRFFWYGDAPDGVTIDTAIDGCIELLVNASEIGQAGRLQVEAIVTEDETNIVNEDQMSINLKSNEVEFEQLSYDYFKKGLPYFFKCRVTYPDKTAAVGENVTVYFKNIYKNYTVGPNGIVTSIIPSYIIAGDSTQVTVKWIGEKEKGPMGSTYARTLYANINTYFSPSNSVMRINLLNEDSIQCPSGENEEISVNVLYVANGTNSALVRTQIIARSEVILTETQEVELEEKSNPSYDADLYLDDESEDTNEEGLVKGYFTSSFEITNLASPIFYMLVWYVREDGEVVSAYAKVNIDKCLNNPTSLELKLENEVAEPKDNISFTISSKVNSFCGLRVIDRSVDLMTPQILRNPFAIDKIFEYVNLQPPSGYWKSDDQDSCKRPYNDDLSPPAPMEEWDMMPQPQFKRSIKSKRSEKSYYIGYSDNECIGSKSNFEKVSLLVWSDLNYNTCPCKCYESSYGGGGGIYPQGGIYEDLMPPAMESEQSKPSTTEEESEDPVERINFPETWLFDILLIDDSGSTKVESTVPDTITEWVADAVCVNAEYGIGYSGISTITVFSIFFMDLHYWPFGRVGEILPVIVSVFNYADTLQPVTVTLFANEAYESPIMTQELCVPAGGKDVATFNLTLLKAGTYDLHFEAVIEKTTSIKCGVEGSVDKRDIVIKKINIKHEGIEKEKPHSGYLCADDDNLQWNITTPEDIVQGSERVFITAIADIIGLNVDDLEHLIRMPYGCGEQNMLRFAPNIYVMMYLVFSHQLTPENKAKLIQHMVQGYQRELQYRRKGGSYSAFGESDAEGSAWLTAFVLKCFNQAKDYIYIDEKDLTITENWLTSLQVNIDGCFIPVGRVIHKDMQGGLTAGGSTAGDEPTMLTAFILIALLETNPTKDDLNDAINCLINSESDNPYLRALRAYVLALIDSDTEPGDDINFVYTQIIDGTTGLSEAVQVEIAGYLLLAMLTNDANSYAGEALNLVKFINGKRNGNQGFVSSQDTVIALQALAIYFKSFSITDVNLNIDFDVGGEQVYNFLITQENRLVLQKDEVLESPPYLVNVSASGEGCAVVMVTQRYNVITEGCKVFTLEVETYQDICGNRWILEIFASYNLPGESNMVILDIAYPSGNTFEEDVCHKLIHGGQIKRCEVDKEIGVVHVYLESLSQEGKNLIFYFEEDSKVENVKPGTVDIYDYYKPAEGCSKVMPNVTLCDEVVNENSGEDDEDDDKDEEDSGINEEDSDEAEEDSGKDEVIEIKPV